MPFVVLCRRHNLPPRAKELFDARTAYTTSLRKEVEELERHEVFVAWVLRCGDACPRGIRCQARRRVSSGQAWAFAGTVRTTLVSFSCGSTVCTPITALLTAVGNLLAGLYVGDSIAFPAVYMAAEGPNYGRRAPGTEEQQGDAPRPVVKGWGEDTMTKEESIAPMMVPTGGSDPVDLPTPTPVDEGNHGQSAQRTEEEEALGEEVAAAPVEYHSAMPKLSELDLGMNWAKIHAICNEELDMTCQTCSFCSLRPSC